MLGLSTDPPNVPLNDSPRPYGMTSAPTTRQTGKLALVRACSENRLPSTVASRRYCPARYTVRSISEAKPVSNSPGKGCTSGVFTSARLTCRGRLLAAVATKSAYESGGPTGLLRLQEATQRPNATA